MDPAKLVLIPLGPINRNPINLDPINPTPTNLPLIDLVLIHPVLIKRQGEVIIEADHLRQNSPHPNLLNTHHLKVLPTAAKAVVNHIQERTDPQVAAHLLVLQERL